MFTIFENILASIANFGESALGWLPFSFDTGYWSNLHFDSPPLLLMEMMTRLMWIPLALVLWKGAKEIWIIQRWGLFSSINPYILLRFHIPKGIEVSPARIEQIFNHVHGTMREPTWWERWWKGQYNLSLSFEIHGKDGNITYYIRCAHKHKNIVQEALNLHYPGAWLEEVMAEEDYAKSFPVKTVPDTERDMLGSEYVLGKSYAYPLKTYRHFIDPQTGAYNDPLGNMLEMMSNLNPGEEVWYHLSLVPRFDNWQADVIAEINKLRGAEQKETKKTGGILNAPYTLGKEIADQVLGPELPYQGKQVGLLGYEVARQVFGLKDVKLSEPSASPATPPEKKAEGVASPLEIDVIKEMENKVRTPGFNVKIRTIYWGKNEVFSKFRFWSELHGGFRNFNHFKLNYLIRGPRTKTTTNYAFAKKRKIYRQNRLISNAKARDWYAGDNAVILNSEELASLWHPPSPKLTSINVDYARARISEPSPELRKRTGYAPEELLPNVKGAVPDDLPMEEFKPLNYK